MFNQVEWQLAYQRVISGIKKDTHCDNRRCKKRSSYITKPKTLASLYTNFCEKKREQEFVFVEDKKKKIIELIKNIENENQLIVLEKILEKIQYQPS